MAALFSLDAQASGTDHHVAAESDGYGIAMQVDGQALRARSYREAVVIARNHMSAILIRAEHGDVSWGFRVRVPDGVAVYGEWPPEERSAETTAVVRIRDDWQGSGPSSALDNALEILRAYATTRSQT